MQLKRKPNHPLAVHTENQHSNHEMKLFRNIIVFSILAGITVWVLLPQRYSINPALAVHPADASEINRIQVIDGYQFNVFANDLPGIRMLELTQTGDLIASQPKSGRVLLIRSDLDKDGRSDATEVLLDGLNRPHGLALYQGWLYIAETNRVIRAPFDHQTGLIHTPYEVLIEGVFPGNGGHWTRSLGIGPDEKLYISVGSSCNVCEENNPSRAALLRHDLDGSNGEIFARGLRNTVGFDWHPVTGDLYGTDNGRDLLGDDFPPCELNLIQHGQHYGWPYANGMNIPDPDFGEANMDKVNQSMPPAHEFRAHNAPLGIHFLNTPMQQKEQATALVALHGSWNRSIKDGYKVVALHFEADNRVTETDFMTGFEQAGDVIGRPVDIAQNAHGEVFISDDFSGRIYRITRKPRP